MCSFSFKKFDWYHTRTSIQPIWSVMYSQLHSPNMIGHNTFIQQTWLVTTLSFKQTWLIIYIFIQQISLLTTLSSSLHGHVCAQILMEECPIQDLLPNSNTNEQLCICARITQQQWQHTYRFRSSLVPRTRSRSWRILYTTWPGSSWASSGMLLKTKPEAKWDKCMVKILPSYLLFI